MTVAKLSSELNVESVLGVDGVIGDLIDNFKPRQGQIDMALLIEEAIAQGESKVIEASTGIGKSFSYLVPAFLCNKKVIVSTGTKNLQDQLFNKDIPLIRKAIVSSKKTALLKGRSNYCCPHRIQKHRSSGQFKSREMSAIFRALSAWSDITEIGDISEFPNIPENDSLWFYATSNADNCLGSDCPEIDRCFVVKARKKALDADLVVINHHLYFSDLALKEDGFGEILPEAEVIVFDEAHQLPDIASHFYGEQFGMRQIETLCKDAVDAEISEAPDSRLLQQPCDQLKKSLADFQLSLQPFPQKAEWMRIQNAKPILTSIEQLQSCITLLEQSLEALASRGKELASCHHRLQELDALLNKFLSTNDNLISWYEWNDRSFRLALSPIEVSQPFQRQLAAASFKTAIFTSATLSSQQSFRYYNDRLGFSDIDSSSFESPFDFTKQALLYLPPQLPDPSDDRFPLAFGELCRQMIQLTRGHCFILFTSYRMLSFTADFLRRSIDYPLFVQGELQRSDLLQQYLKADNPVLLGTSSFWEGVDVKGDQLRCVIIDKLPFKSPGDPVYKRRLQQASQNGGNAFMDIQVPEATISLRQGVGRLIRDLSDHGIVVLGDNRLKGKSYGKGMLQSLPAMPQTDDFEDVTQFAGLHWSAKTT
ncbi:MAG: ATP-dependent DNA helicase DinG [Planctomycetota bacterium]|jgi:ATP-dependent DNA helicase DinG